MNETEFRHLPSGGTVVGCLAAVVVAVFLLVLLSAPNQSNPSATVVPQYNTAEYEEYTRQFAETHGREWGEEDQMRAVYNGGHISIGLLGYMFAVVIVYFEIYEWCWWFRDRKSYANQETDTPPKPLKAMLVETAICLIFVILFGGYMWLIAPHMVIANP